MSRTEERKTSHSYYVVMVDYGPNYIGKKGPSGFEAVVDPERTRRGVVEMIRTGEYRNIAFIHHVDGLYVYDCTAELMHDAGVQMEAA